MRRAGELRERTRGRRGRRPCLTALRRFLNRPLDDADRPRPVRDRGRGHRRRRGRPRAARRRRPARRRRRAAGRRGTAAHARRGVAAPAARRRTPAPRRARRATRRPRAGLARRGRRSQARRAPLPRRLPPVRVRPRPVRADPRASPRRCARSLARERPRVPASERAPAAAASSSCRADGRERAARRDHRARARRPPPLHRPRSSSRAPRRAGWSPTRRLTAWPRPPSRSPPPRSAPRRAGASCSRSLGVLGVVARAAHRVARRDLRHAAAAGAATARPGPRASEIPPLYLRALPRGGRPLRDRPLDPRGDRLDRDRPRSVAAPGRALRASTRSGAAPGRCSSPSSARPAPGTATASTATATAAAPRTTPADAIPAAARYLRASGAPGDYRRAIFAYNHADWYVNDVLAQADAYRGAAGAAPAAGAPAPAAASAGDVLANRAHRRSRRSSAPTCAPACIDPRVLATLAWIGRRHSRDRHRAARRPLHRQRHVPTTPAGRAMDIGAVDGEICRGTRTGACADLVRELAAVDGPLRATELIYCWDPDGPQRPARLRARRPLRPHPLGHGRLSARDRPRATGTRAP